MSELGHTASSVKDTVAPDKEVVGSIIKAGNSSASATITITMMGVLSE